MCTKTPKPTAPAEQKPVQYIRNPWLDGLAIGQSQGRNSLRIDRTNSGGLAVGKPLPGLSIPGRTVTKAPYKSGLAIPTAA